MSQETKQDQIQKKKIYLKCRKRKSPSCYRSQSYFSRRTAKEEVSIDEAKANVKRKKKKLLKKGSYTLPKFDRPPKAN